jgi:putative ABC transport system permease protein
MIKSLRGAARALRQRPAYTLLSIALLALGVGAMGAIFSIVDVALVRPLPYQQPDRLVWLQAREPVTRDSSTVSGLVPLQVKRWREEEQQFVGIEGAQQRAVTLAGPDEPVALTSFQVSAGLFSLLGVAPARGRPFTRDEEFSASTVLIISDDIWRSRFGGDPAIIGRTLTIDGTPRTIIGIMPRDFALFFVSADLYVPLPLEPVQMQSRFRAILTVGRLKPGVSVAQATNALDRINDGIAMEVPFFRKSRAGVQPLRDALFGSSRSSLLVMLGAVSLLLLIACSNVMNLALSDAVTRRQATMTRIALGASPWQILKLRLAEAMLITTGAAGGGFVLARGALAGLRVANPSYFNGFGSLGVDGRLVAFTFGIALVSGIAATMPAAVAESRMRVRSLASAGARSLGGTTDRRIRDLLLGGQVAVALVLLFGAALLGRNLRALWQAPQGFNASRLVAVTMPAPARYATAPERASYLQRLIDAVAAIPGVEVASASQTFFSLGSSSLTFIAIDGVPLADSTGIVVNIRHIMPGWFGVLQTRLIAGRLPNATDRDGSIPVAVVSASFARRHLAGHAIGARIRRTANPTFPWMEVVGVVDDAKDAGMGVDLGPTLFVPYLQENQPTVTMTIVARARDGLSSLDRPIRRAIHTIDGTQAINRIRAVDDIQSESAAQPRFQALVVALFGIGALALVIGGIYALTLFALLRRTRELGLRAALGASPHGLVIDSVWRGVRPVLVGIGGGLALAIPAISVMQHALKENLGLGDIPLLAAVLGFLVIATTLAALMPALRALRIEPAAALRE